LHNNYSTEDIKIKEGASHHDIQVTQYDRRCYIIEKQISKTSVKPCVTYWGPEAEYVLKSAEIIKVILK